VRCPQKEKPVMKRDTDKTETAGTASTLNAVLFARLEKWKEEYVRIANEIVSNDDLTSEKRSVLRGRYRAMSECYHDIQKLISK
jgi:hypothetical protein